MRQEKNDAKSNLQQKLSNGSILFIFLIRTGHRLVTLNNFKILSSGFKLPRDRKIAEALLIKSRKPGINVQGASVP